MPAWARGLASHPGARTWLAPLTPALAPATDPLQQILTGHTGGVRSVAVTADGTTALSGGGGTVRVWDLATGELRVTLTGHISVSSAAEDTQNQELLTVEETAEILQIGRYKVYYLLRTRQLRSIKIGKLRRISRAWIAEFMEGLEKGMNVRTSSPPGPL